MKPNTPRAARKKLLLLEGTLHRLEILEAKQALRSGVANSYIGRHLPGALAILLQNKGSALLTTVLPLLLGGSRLSRIARRATLALGAGAALLGLLNRWNRGRPAADQAAEDGAAAGDEENSDEKNPGQDRD